jgi:hypothetical protein
MVSYEKVEPGLNYIKSSIHAEYSGRLFPFLALQSEMYALFKTFHVSLLVKFALGD